MIKIINSSQLLKYETWSAEFHTLDLHDREPTAIEYQLAESISTKTEFKEFQSYTTSKRCTALNKEAIIRLASKAVPILTARQSRLQSELQSINSLLEETNG